jgi:hypothetical protein
MDHARANARGFGLLVVLLWLSLLSTLALGVALATSVEPQATGALHERLRLVRAAESAVALAAASLGPTPDWTAVPAVGLAGPYTDGAPGLRALGSLTLDLEAETNERTCGRRSPACDDVATRAASPERPWGDANPRWRLVVHVPFAAVDAVGGAACRCYLAAWVADDPADNDGDALADSPVGTAGHGVLLVRGAAFGEVGGVAEVEALVSKPCPTTPVGCPGIRVQSWGSVSQALP